MRALIVPHSGFVEDANNYFIISGINCIKLNLEISNDGQDVSIRPQDVDDPIYFTEGPLSYRYRFHGAVVKFSSTSEKGSEHQIEGKTFPGEVGFLVLLFIDSCLFSELLVSKYSLQL